jgi:hypothetical protein
VLNLGATERDIRAETLWGLAVKLSTFRDREGEIVSDHLAMRPNEGLILGPPA